jgi:nicotinate phosphoribosyltransferase
MQLNIPNSLLDNDLYKFTMMQAVWETHPEALVEYQFINRRISNTFSVESLLRIKERIKNLCQARLTNEELKFLGNLPFIKPEFIEFLRNFQLREDTVHAFLNEAGHLNIHIKGLWVDTILWEMPLMGIVSETYFEVEDTNWIANLDEYYERTLVKGQRLTEAECEFMEFGSRRRRSFHIQDTVVKAFSTPEIECAGTSNVYLAMKHGLKPLGTMAHEWIMGFAGIYGVENANKKALEAWRQVYGDQLGVALTDTYTTDLFFKDIKGELARLWETLRHDSECPFEFGQKVLDFYKKEKIETTKKKIVFSDSLNVDKAIDIEKFIAKRTRTNYGIGTHFTNDFPGSAALNIVIKLYSINGVLVAKISDNPAKASGHPEAIKTAIKIINN